MFLIDTLRRLRQESRDIRYLKEMSDYQLRDLGVSRSEIAHRVRQGKR